MKNTFCILLSLFLCISPLTSIGASAAANNDISTYSYTRASDINFYCDFLIGSSSTTFYTIMLSNHTGKVTATLQVYDSRFTNPWRDVATKTVNFQNCDGVRDEIIYTGYLAWATYRLKSTVTIAGYNTTTIYSGWHY